MDTMGNVVKITYTVSGFERLNFSIDHQLNMFR